ncbi:MAG: hypothetical protein ACFE85_17060 [Candidatus Hodarchaeota archaeon]
MLEFQLNKKKERTWNKEVVKRKIEDLNRKIKNLQSKVCLVDGKIVSEQDFFKIWNEE